MKAVFCAILAAGRGKRMNTSKVAPLMSVSGRALVEWAASHAAECCESKPVIVQGPGREIEAALGDAYTYVVQSEPEGEADALRTAFEKAGDVSGPILVMYANVPLIGPEYLNALTEAASRDGAASLIWSDDDSEDIQNAGAWCFMDWALKEALEACSPQTTIPECVDALRNRGMNIHEMLIDSMHCARAVDRASLWYCEYVMNSFILATHFENGVSFMDMAATHIEHDVKIGRDTVIWPGVILTGKTEIGENCVIKNGCTLNDTKVGDGCELHYVVSNDAVIGNGVKIGPFVNIRPNTVIADGCKIGDFMEIKNSNIGRGTKLPHLSYVGDADVGERVNVGCGAIFVNYDGYKKHRTTVGNDVFIGCQTNLVAPVTVGDNAYTAAGSTICRDVPAGAMAIARARQENKEDYVEKFRNLKTKQ